jgi:hypothetical protein
LNFNKTRASGGIYIEVLRNGAPLHKGTRVYADSGYQGIQHFHEDSDYPYKKPKKGELSAEEKEYNTALATGLPCEMLGLPQGSRLNGASAGMCHSRSSLLALGFCSLHFKWDESRFRVKVENVLGEIKRFRIMPQRYRNKRINLTQDLGSSLEW